MGYWGVEGRARPAGIAEQGAGRKRGLLQQQQQQQQPMQEVARYRQGLNHNADAV
jgi:hypothetical protein